jgi:hypothetical protein
MHHLEWLQVRLQQLEIRRRQRSQQTIGMLNRSHRAFPVHKASATGAPPPTLRSPSGLRPVIVALYGLDMLGTSVVRRTAMRPDQKNIEDMFATEPTVCRK